MSHFKAKQADIKSRAPVSAKTAHIVSQEHPFQNGCATLKTATFPISRDLVVRMSTKESMVENIPTIEAIVENISVNNEDNFEGRGRNNQGLK